MKIKYPLKCCPWCERTPVFRMDCGKPTWLCIVRCDNADCNVRPTIRHVCIRKKQRENVDWIRTKVCKAINMWNSANIYFKNEGFEIDYEKIVEDFLSGQIGKPGYRKD